MAGDPGAVYGYAADVLVAEEGGAFGAALMAGVGAGVWPDLEAACAAAIEVAQQMSLTRKPWSGMLWGIRRTGRFIRR